MANMAKQLGDLQPDKQKALLARFWKRVKKQKDGCWVWGGAASNAHYGQIGDGERGTMRTHRLSWEIHNGPIPEGMFICHTCDVRRCVNPQHLFLGDVRDNSADMYAKGREQLGKARTAPGTVILRVGTDLHGRLKAVAREQGTSMNMLITIILAGALSSDDGEIEALVKGVKLPKK